MRFLIWAPEWIVVLFIKIGVLFIKIGTADKEKQELENWGDAGEDLQVVG